MSSTNDFAHAEEDLDGITLLHMNHVAITNLLAALLDSIGSPITRRRQLNRLVRLLSAHELTEKDVLYPAVQCTNAGDEVIRSCLEQHRRTNALARRMCMLASDDSAWSLSVQELAASIRYHLSYEQDILLPLARRIFDGATLSKLGCAMGAMLRTRPHDALVAMPSSRRTHPTLPRPTWSRLTRVRPQTC